MRATFCQASGSYPVCQLRWTSGKYWPNVCRTLGSGVEYSLGSGVYAISTVERSQDMAALRTHSTPCISISNIAMWRRAQSRLLMAFLRPPLWKGKTTIGVSGTDDYNFSTLGKDLDFAVSRSNEAKESSCIQFHLGTVWPSQASAESDRQNNVADFWAEQFMAVCAEKICYDMNSACLLLSEHVGVIQEF